MRVMFVVASFALVLAGPARAEDPGALRTFIACPIYRDTDAGRKSGCWLADDPVSGVRYDIGAGLAKPMIGRMVLVEGITSNQPSTPCGGRVLAPVRTSVLPDRCTRRLIAAEGFPGRPYKSPPEQLQPASVPRTLPPPPYDTKTFTIFFELGRDFLVYQYSEMILEKIMLYAKASQAKHVRIEAYAATAPFEVQGRKLSEPMQLAQARADMVAEALRRLGVPANTLTEALFGDPAPSPELESGMLPEASKRRVVITVVP
jgi:outer membrane protein OmpA-like peptidoglycan-associated protein